MGLKNTLFLLSDNGGFVAMEINPDGISFLTLSTTFYTFQKVNQLIIPII